MALIACTVCIFTMCFIRLWNKKIINPAFSFSLIFLFVMILNSSGLYEIYMAPDRAFSIIMIGVVSFALGATVQNKFNIVIKNQQNRESVFNPKAYWVMTGICILILIFNLNDILMYLRSGFSIGDLYLTAARASRGESNILTQSDFVVILEQYIAYPLLYLLVPTSLVVFFKEYKTRYLLIAVLLTSIRIILDARRTYLVSFIIMLMVCYYLHRNDAEFSRRVEQIKAKKWRKRIILLLVIIGAIFVYITVQRYVAEGRGDEANIFKTLVYYYGGSVTYLDHSIQSFNGNYTYGFSTLRGFFAPLFSISSRAGIGAPNAFARATNILNSMSGNITSISPTKRFNSFATAFFQFYCDAGMLGVVLNSLFFGMYSQNLYMKFSRYKDVRFEAKYLFWYSTVLMMSFVNVGLVLPLAAWPLLIERLLYSHHPIDLQGE